MIALALALALGAAGAPAAREPAAPNVASTPPPPAAPAEVASLAGDAEPDADVMAFLSLSHSTASRDGGVKLPWDGPGGTQLRLSWDALDKRNDQLALGDMMARALVDAVRTYYDAQGGVDPAGMRAKLVGITGGPMEEARAAYLDAVTWEERRLFFVERAIGLADAERATLPGVDPDLVRRRAKAIRSGALKKAIAARVDAYNDLALGLVAYLDGDNFKALEKVRNAAGALPDFAVARAFLGSLYFLFDQKEAAVREWRRSYELDPTNEAVKQALEQYGHRGNPPPAKRERKERDRP